MSLDITACLVLGCVVEYAGWIDWRDGNNRIILPSLASLRIQANVQRGCPFAPMWRMVESNTDFAVSAAR